MPTPVDHRAYVVDNSAQRESTIDKKNNTKKEQQSCRGRASEISNKQINLASRARTMCRGALASTLLKLIISISHSENNEHIVNEQQSPQKQHQCTQRTSVRSAGNRDSSAGLSSKHESGAHLDCCNTIANEYAVTHKESSVFKSPLKTKKPGLY